MLVHDFLRDSAGHWPAKVALVCDDQRLTYGEIERRTNSLAALLISLGVRRGDRVALYMPNRIELVVGIFGILKAGGVFVVINHSTKQEKLNYIIRNCQARGIIVDQRRAGVAGQVTRSGIGAEFCLISGKSPHGDESLPGGSYWLEDMLASQEAVYRPASIIDRDLACLIYTSGSTGEPKGVMSDHSNMVFAADSIISYLGNVHDDIIINVLPLSFDYGLYQLLMTFRFGGTLVLEQNFSFPAHLLRQIERERVTGLPGVPTIYSVLIQMDLSPYDLSSLRYMTNTAAALPVSHILSLRRKFPDVTLFSMYGLTETKRTLYLPPAELDNRPASVGIAIPGTEVWLAGDDGSRLGPGEIGELVVRGRHVMRGYWGDLAATARRFRAGPIPGETVCYTGDLFRMDEDGYFYFISRKDDIIKCRGEKVAPKEIESVLYMLPDVVEVAVIGVPDPIMGQAIKAVIVSGGDKLTEAAVMAHCRANLEEIMLPKYVEFRAELPKTTSGKIQKLELS